MYFNARLVLLSQSHFFHLMGSSFWPLLLSFSALFLTVGGVMSMHSFIHGNVLIVWSFVLWVFVVFSWWNDLLKEGTYRGFHTVEVQSNFRSGILLFIVSEIMFFFAFFWAFFHSSFVPCLEVGSIWPSEGLIMMDAWGVPFLNTLVLLLSGVFMTRVHHSILEGVGHWFCHEGWCDTYLEHGYYDDSYLNPGNQMYSMCSDFLGDCNSGYLFYAWEDWGPHDWYTFWYVIDDNLSPKTKLASKLDFFGALNLYFIVSFEDWWFEFLYSEEADVGFLIWMDFSMFNMFDYWIQDMQCWTVELDYDEELDGYYPDPENYMFYERWVTYLLWQPGLDKYGGLHTPPYINCMGGTANFVDCWLVWRVNAVTSLMLTLDKLFLLNHGMSLHSGGLYFYFVDSLVPSKANFVGVGLETSPYGLLDKYSESYGKDFYYFIGRGFMLTLALAILFICFQYVEYSDACFGISDGIYGSSFYMATGFHGFHVIVGATFLYVCFSSFFSHNFESYHHVGLEGAIWYWHFVDVVWLFLFVSIYWWGGV